MPDYDVGVTGLAVPPSTAYLQAYRPAVSVKNHGIHDALAVGSLRIYQANKLLFTTELYSGTIAPGETEPAQAIDYWTPDAVGKYMFIADVTCEHDQYEPNNHLPPTWIEVTAAPPPPPPPVPLHAAQHEDGGADELNTDGLAGQLREAQTPKPHRDTHAPTGNDPISVLPLHAETHEEGGSDEIAITGALVGDHHENHEDGGSDELNVEGLGGVLANLQKPKVHANEAHDPNYSEKPHGNECHDPDFVTATALEEHKNAVTAHALADNLEKAANKGAVFGYAPLDESAHVPWTALPAIIERTTNKGAANGYAPLDADSQVPAANITATEKVANKGASFGYAGLDEFGDVPWAQLPAVERTVNKGAPSGYAPLDAGSKVPEANLPGMPPTVHGADKHDATVEATANKGAPNGYAGLDATPLTPRVPAVNLGGNPMPIPEEGFLRGDRIWHVVPTSAHGNESHTFTAEDLAHKGAASGYAPLDADTKVPYSNLPPADPIAHHARHENNGTDQMVVGGLTGLLATAQTPLSHGNDKHSTPHEILAQKGAAVGYCGLDAYAQVPLANVTALEKIANKGVALGYAPLDGLDRVPEKHISALHHVYSDYNEHLGTFSAPGSIILYEYSIPEPPSPYDRLLISADIMFKFAGTGPCTCETDFYVYETTTPHEVTSPRLRFAFASIQPTDVSGHAHFGLSVAGWAYPIKVRIYAECLLPNYLLTSLTQKAFTILASH